MWISHSTFHIPMHFSRVRNETFSKDNSTFHIPKFWNGIGMWIPHSTFQIRMGWIPNSKFRIPNPWNRNWELHLHSKFHSIPIPLWLSQTYLQCCSILSSIPIPQWMEWNVESRFDTGCCLELLFARTMGLNSADRTRALCGSKSVQNRFCLYVYNALHTSPKLVFSGQFQKIRVEFLICNTSSVF